MELFYQWNHDAFAARIRRIEYFLAERGKALPRGKRKHVGRRRIAISIAARTPAIAAAVFDGLKQKKRKHPVMARVAAWPSVVFYCFLMLILTGTAAWLSASAVPNKPDLSTVHDSKPSAATRGGNQ
jgi:hypothetical protein